MRRNNRGSITIDYLFAFFLVSGFCLVIITFSATLATIELTQYLAFAAARNYFAGNLTESHQKARAQQKFIELKSHPAVAPLLNGGWFQVPNASVIVDYNIPQKYPAFQGYISDGNINLFHGVIVDFHARILDFQIPLFGGTKKDGVNEGGFKTHITSFLGREPTYDECNSFNKQRWQAIKKLSNSMGATGYSSAQGDNTYVVINDNGC